MIIDDLGKQDDYKACGACARRPNCRNDECELGTREREEVTEAFPPAVVEDARTCLALRLEHPPPGMFGPVRRRRFPKRWDYALLSAVRIVDGEASRYEADAKKAKKAEKESARGDRPTHPATDPRRRAVDP
jgi:hypothetical protein